MAFFMEEAQVDDEDDGNKNQEDGKKKYFVEIMHF